MTRPLTIIGSYVSPYVRKVLACMNLKGLDFEVDPITPFFGNEEFRRVSPIKFSQLREAMKEERKREARPEFYGARPTKREERPFREATRFY